MAVSAAAHIAAFAALAAQRPAPDVVGQPAVNVMLVRAAPEPAPKPEPTPSKPRPADAPGPRERPAPKPAAEPSPRAAEPATPEPADAAGPPLAAPQPIVRPTPAPAEVPDAGEAWRRRVWARLAAHAPRSEAGAGVARVAFSLDASGGLVRVRLIRSSGRPAFDRACLAAVRAAAPFPSPPIGLGASDRDFEVPIRPVGGG